jgi:Outer membrane protein beta-barrel domain
MEESMGFRFARPVLCLALLLTGAASVTQAQLNLGLTGGVNFSTINNDDLDATTTTGGVGGGYVSIGFGPNLSIEGQVLYTQKGAETDAGDLRQGYLQIPALLKFHFGSGEGTRLYIFGGPALNWQWDCTVTTDVDELDCEDVPFAGNPEDATFSGMLGLGVQFGRLGVEGRYETGFSDSIENIDSKDGTFSLLARLAILGSR